MTAHQKYLREFQQSCDNLTPEGRIQLYKKVQREKIVLNVIPSLASLTGFFGWMLIFGKGTDYIEHVYHLDFIADGGVLGILLALISGYGAAIAFAICLYCLILSRLNRNTVLFRFSGGRCVYCGYSLQGHLADLGGVRCPECGKRSPIFAHRDAVDNPPVQFSTRDVVKAKSLK